MTLKREDVLRQITEFRDFSEHLDKQAAIKGFSDGHELCIALYDAGATPPREFHIHLTSAMLDHCVDALEQSLLGEPERQEDCMIMVRSGRKQRALAVFKAWGWLVPWALAVFSLALGMHI